MARVTEQVRAGDVSFWGVFAVVTLGLAVGSASLSALVPSGVIGWLHASRAEGGSVVQLRAELDDLKARTAELSEQNTTLQQRFNLADQSSTAVTRRIAALEVSVPRLVEAVNSGTQVDTGAVTAAIGAVPTTTRDVPGGTVSYSTSPMKTTVPTIAIRGTTQAMPQPLVAEVTPDANAFGVALGPPIDSQDGAAAWQAMRTKVGTLLLGLGPVLAHVEGGPGRKLVAGPLGTEADAQEICGRMARVGVACSVTAFVGDPVQPY